MRSITSSGFAPDALILTTSETGSGVLEAGVAHPLSAAKKAIAKIRCGFMVVVSCEGSGAAGQK